MCGVAPPHPFLLILRANWSDEPVLINIKETERKNPIQETKIYVSAPKLNNILPENVRVVANSLQATNGDIYGINFTKDNYKYDENTGNLEITVSNNADENGNIVSNEVYAANQYYFPVAEANEEADETYSVPVSKYVKNTSYFKNSLRSCRRKEFSIIWLFII